MNLENKIEENSNLLQVLKGMGIAVIITLILLFVFSILLTYTSISEATIPAVVIFITGVSILVGSSIVNNKIKKNGIVNGGIIGGLYVILLYIISSIVSGSFQLTMASLIMVVVGILAGMLGGIIGVNLK